MCLVEIPVIHPGNITSEGYPHGYPSDQQCLIVLGTLKNHHVRMQFRDFDIEKSDNCAKDSVTVRDCVAQI